MASIRRKLGLFLFVLSLITIVIAVGRGLWLVHERAEERESTEVRGEGGAPFGG